MRSIYRLIYALFFSMLLLPLAPALAGVFQEVKAPQPDKPELPPGDGRDLLVKNCTGCHQLTVVTSQHKSESGWTDTVIEMRNRGANGSDEDMEHIIHYLTANFGPLTASSTIVNVNSASASDIVTGLSLPHTDADAIVAYRTKNGKFKDINGLKQVPGIDTAKIDDKGPNPVLERELLMNENLFLKRHISLSFCRRAAAAVLFLGIVGGVGFAQALPQKKRQPTPEKVIAEHIAALNACDWNRMMAQYDDDTQFWSKDGGIVKGREAIGGMFEKMLQPPTKGGQCGMKLIPEHMVVVGDTVNVIWRVEAPFFAEPYRGAEAFETRNGLLVLQVTTWDPSAIKMKKQ